MSSQMRNSTAEVAVIGFIAFEAQQDLPVYSHWMKCGDGIEGNGKPPGFAAIGVFLFFGATMASLAATTLLLPGTFLDRTWTLNPTAYKRLSPLGSKGGVLFLLLAVILVASGIGWFRRRHWGWTLAVVIIGIQVVGDIINLIRGDWLRGGTGVIIAGALLLYLLTPRVRAAFFQNDCLESEEGRSLRDARVVEAIYSMPGATESSWCRSAHGLRVTSSHQMWSSTGRSMK